MKWIPQTDDWAEKNVCLTIVDEIMAVVEMKTNDVSFQVTYLH